MDSRIERSHSLRFRIGIDFDIDFRIRFHIDCHMTNRTYLGDDVARILQTVNRMVIIFQN